MSHSPLPCLGLQIQAEHGKLLKDFYKGLDGNAAIATLRGEVEAFAASFDMPGYSVAGLK